MRLFPRLLRWSTARYNFSPGAETTWERISAAGPSGKPAGTQRPEDIPSSAAECRSEGPQAGGVRTPGKDGGEMAPISALWRAA